MKSEKILFFSSLFYPLKSEAWKLNLKVSVPESDSAEKVVKKINGKNDGKMLINKSTNTITIRF